MQEKVILIDINTQLVTSMFFVCVSITHIMFQKADEKY